MAEQSAADPRCTCEGLTAAYLPGSHLSTCPMAYRPAVQVGPSATGTNPPVAERSPADNVRIAFAAPQLLDSLLAVEWGGSADDEDGESCDCCPNCIAPSPDSDHMENPGIHYAHCELRDSLDAALGVKSERVVHPAYAKAAL